MVLHFLDVQRRAPKRSKSANKNTRLSSEARLDAAFECSSASIRMRPEDLHLVCISRPIQKNHLGLTSCSISVSSLYSYHFPPAASTGKGGRTKISTGLGTWTTKPISPPVSTPLGAEDVLDWLNGSTDIHPSPDIATSQAGLSRIGKWKTNNL